MSPFSGVGGEAMEAEGLKSLFPIADIAVMGILPVLARLPTLFARIRTTAEAVIAATARRPRYHRQPRLHPPRRPPGARGAAELADCRLCQPQRLGLAAWPRARRCGPYVDCVLALLPFEPEAYRRLGGPRCVYVGHPLIERLGELRPNGGRGAPVPLPSRRSSSSFPARADPK